jgi:hypothetical protein
VVSPHSNSFRSFDVEPASVKYRNSAWREAKSFCLVFADVSAGRCNCWPVCPCGFVLYAFGWEDPQAYILACVKLKMNWDILPYTQMHRMYLPLMEYVFWFYDL